MTTPLSARRPLLAWTSVARLAGLFLLILGTKFQVLRTCSSPLPVFDQWDAEGQRLLRPYLEGNLHLADLFAPWNEHRIVLTRLLTLGLFGLNGQWDTQVEAIAAALLHAGTAILLGAILVRRLGRKCEDAVLICLLLLFALPFSQEDTLSGGFASQYYLLLLFGILTIRGLATHRPGSPGWWTGAAAGVAAWFTVAAGGLPALAVAAWAGLCLGFGKGSRREHGITLGMALALAAGGFCLRIGVGSAGDLQARSVGELLARLAGLLAWPNFTTWAAPVACAPFACLLWRTFRRRGGGPAEAFLIPLGFFILLLTAALAYARNRYGGVTVSRYMDFLSLGTLVNFACLLRLMQQANAAPDRLRARVRLGAATAAWVAVTGFGLAHLTTGNLASDLAFVKSCNDRELAFVAAFVADGDRPRFLGLDPFAIQCEKPSLAADLLSNPAIRRILPWQVRPAVELEAAVVSPHIRKVTDPAEPGKSGWLLAPGAGGQPLHFRSQALQGLRFPYLRFPETSNFGANGDAFVALVGERAGEVNLLEQDPARDGWQPVVVEAPAGTFRVEAVVKAGFKGRLAFSCPKEVGRLSVWVDPLLDSPTRLLFIGFGIWLGAIYWQRLGGIFRSATAAGSNAKPC